MLNERMAACERNHGTSGKKEAPAAGREDIMQYVQGNWKEIKRMAAKRIRSTPYEMEDVLQEAYAAALVALRTHEKAGMTFDHCFWSLMVFRLKSLCFTSVIAKQIVDGEQASAAAQVSEIHQREDARIREALTKWSVSLMHPRQAQVWNLSLSRERPSTEAIAKKMKIRRQSVEELQKRGLGRVRRTVMNKGLPPDLARIIAQ